MSHFTVLVATKADSRDDLAAALQPYHEFESTGTEDQYVVDVDETEALRGQWQEGTTTRLRSPDGNLHEPYDDQFYRDPTAEDIAKLGPLVGTGWAGGISYTSKDWGDGRGYRAKVKFTPDGWEEVKVPLREAQTFREWVKDYTSRDEVLPGGRAKYGWTEVTSLGPEGKVVRCIDRTNPNKKWDWWAVGGRWSGMLTLKPNAKTQNGMGRSCDSARKGDVDMESKIKVETTKAGTDWDEAHAIIAGRTWMAWDEVRQKHGAKMDKARKVYWGQEALRALSESERFRWGFDQDDFLLDRATYARRKGLQAAMTFAILHNGEWHEKGEMGMWATVFNEKDRESWEDEWFRVYNSIPDDYTITVVDCHI